MLFQFFIPEDTAMQYRTLLLMMRDGQTLDVRECEKIIVIEMLTYQRIKHNTLTLLKLTPLAPPPFILSQIVGTRVMSKSQSTRFTALRRSYEGSIITHILCRRAKRTKPIFVQDNKMVE